MKREEQRLRMVLAVVLAGSCFSTSGSARANGPRLARNSAPSHTEPELYVADEFVVVLNRDARARVQIATDADGLPALNLASLHAAARASGVRAFEREFPDAIPRDAASKYPDLTGHFLVKLRDPADLAAAMERFRNDPAVEHVEKIGVHTTGATPNDTQWFSLWNLRPPKGVDAQAAWDTTTGTPSVIVAILDTGVRYFHEDLGGPNAPWTPANPVNNGNIFVNPGEIPNNGIDDDANGRVDDTVGYDFLQSSTVAGCSCIDLDCSAVDNNPDDYNGHGTHVSGTAAAITNNARGIAGVAGGYGDGTTSSSGDGVRIMPCRIGWQANCGGTITGLISMSAAAQAMNYVATMVDKGYDVVAINCSWGSSNTGGISAAIANLLAHDVMIVAAAGNSASGAPSYLGSISDVVNVGGTTAGGTGYSSSNYGPWVDIAAPAVNVTSTFRNSSDADPTHHYYASLTGTSMAAPHVCGVTALLESCREDLSSKDVIEILQETSIAYTDPRDLGDGIVNAKNAVAAACSVNLHFRQPVSGSGEEVASNIDWSDMTPNTVAADDFISDGRMVTGLYWWGNGLSAFPPYRVDDDGAEDSIGVNDGASTGGTFGWANRFRNTTGGPITIQTIQVAFGGPTDPDGVSVGDAVDAVIWIDAAATANMVNATPALRWSLPGGVHANDGMTFATHTVPGGVVVPAGADFYVGLGDIQTQNDSVMRFPASIDTTASQGRSWAFFPADIADPFSENLAGQTLGTIDSFGLPGNWLIRAGAETAPAPDGWFVSFHEPLSTGGSPAEPLGLYFCDDSVVSVRPETLTSCDGFPVLEYRATLADCCLVDANVDSRTSTTPAQSGGFAQETCLTYGLDIQAEIGVEFTGGGPCVESSTGRSATAPFWGWHTTTTSIGGGVGLQSALVSQLSVSGSNRLYGPWSAMAPSCSPADMAFALVTTTLSPSDLDIDNNGVPDACEAPTSASVGDDVCVGGSSNGLPCAQHSDCPAGLCGLKNRFVSFVPPVSVVAQASSLGIEVTLVNLDANSVVNPATYNGTKRWVGAPTLGVSDGVSGTFNAAALQCAFYAQDWNAVGRVNAYGAVVVPASSYEVRMCSTAGGPCSTPLPVATAKFGDIIPPLGVTNFQDIVSVVAKFQGSAAGPSKTRTKLAEPVNVNTNVNFQEISTDVAAFQGQSYKQVFPASPGTCP